MYLKVLLRAADRRRVDIRRRLMLLKEGPETAKKGRKPCMLKKRERS